MPRILFELTAEQKAIIACSEAEILLATSLADLVFAEANRGLRPALYLELAAQILMRTAVNSFTHQNARGTGYVDPRRGAELLFSFVVDRATALIESQQAPDKTA